MSLELQIYDSYGRPGGVISGQRVTGPLKGYSGLSYTPRGACFNKPGECHFSLPMTIRNNYPLDVGAMVYVKDTTYGEQGLFVVGDKSESISADGHTAAFSCVDLVEELRWPDVPGFASIETGETLSRVFQRLLNIQDETPWLASLPPALDVTLFDNRFTCDGITVQQAVAGLAAQWFLKWRRGAGRTIEFDTFGKDTGIRLVKPSMRPSAMSRPNIRPMLPNGINPVNDAAGIVNCLVPLGAGDGWAQVSLRDLYNPVGETAVPGTTWYKSGPPVAVWTGYDAAYPIYKRFRYDGGNDGFQYFLIDQTSITNYRKRFARMHTDIGVISGNPLDLAAAAATVWQLGVARLKLFSVKHQSLTVLTVGRGNNVGIGGDLVRVECKEVTNGVTTLDVNGLFVVVDCVRSVSDSTGAYEDRFDVSSIGRAAETTEGIQTGMLQDLQSLRNAATVYPSGYPIWIDAPITPADPIQVPWDEDRGRLATVEATFTVTCYPVYSTVTSGTVAAHHHSVTVPGRSQNASVPYTYEGGYNPTAQAAYGHSAPGAQAAYGHAAPGAQFGHGHGGSATGGTQNNHGHGSSTPAGRAGGGVSENIGVGGGGTVNNSGGVSGLDQHTHSLFIQGGGTPGTLDNGGFVYATNGDAQLRATGSKQTIARTNTQDTYNTGHGHGSSTLATRNGGGVGEDIGVGGGGNVANSGGSFQPTVPITSEGGYTPSVNQHGGFTPAVDTHGGFQPDSRFPGYANDLSYTQTVQTSDDIAPAWTPVYGKFTDPNGAARNIRIFIDGTQIFPAAQPSGVYATSFVVNLTPYLQGQQGRVIEFRSETLGRLLIRATVRTRLSIYHIGA